MLSSFLLSEANDVKKGGPGSGVVGHTTEQKQAERASTPAEHNAAYEYHSRESQHWANMMWNAPKERDQQVFRRLSDNHAAAGSWHREAASHPSSALSAKARKLSANAGSLR